MSLFRTIAMLATAALGIFFFYSIGYAIANHDLMPVLLGVCALVLAALLTVVQVRLGRA